MSFRNTKTPTRKDIKGKAKYQCPMEKRGGQDAYYLTPELERIFAKKYPVTMNRDMMRMFGISFSTMQRFKRQLGLEKKIATIRKKQAKLTKKICEENGYYNSIRGKRPSDACIEASRRKRETGFHPLDVVRRDKRRYKRIMEKRSKQRSEVWRRERIRVNNGLDQRTNLRVPYSPYNRRHIYIRSACKKSGYVLGDTREEQERWTIYYSQSTTRNTTREANAMRLGFRFIQIT